MHPSLAWSGRPAGEALSRQQLLLLYQGFWWKAAETVSAAFLAAGQPVTVTGSTMLPAVQCEPTSHLNHQLPLAVAVQV